jgi:hypothetical protein
VFKTLAEEESKVMKKHLFFTVLVLACALLFMSGTSSATIIYSGSVWDAAYNSSWNAYAENTNLGTPSQAPSATFTVSQINFIAGSSVTSETYYQWLSGGVGNPNGLQTSTNFLTSNNFYTAGNYDGSFFQFTWTETFSSAVNEKLLVSHDDGAYLTVNGVGVSGWRTGPTEDVTDSYTAVLGPGTYTFVLSYGGVNGYPEILTMSETTTSVPEPCTLLLLGAGLVGLATYRRKIIG